MKMKPDECIPWNLVCGGLLQYRVVENTPNTFDLKRNITMKLL